MFFKSLAENKKPRQGRIPVKMGILSLPVASHLCLVQHTGFMQTYDLATDLRSLFHLNRSVVMPIVRFGSFVCGFFVLLLGCVDIKANMPPAHFTPDQDCATGCTFGFHSATGGHMSLGQIAAVRTMP